MKKHSLFKVILIVLGALLAVSGILAILGYFVPALEGKYTMIALGDVLINFVQSFYYFFDTVVYLLVLGAFYGVLNEVPAYKKLVDNIAQKVKGHSELFIFIVISNVFLPNLAEARAASQPACPAPTTITSYFIIFTCFSFGIIQ